MHIRRALAVTLVTSAFGALVAASAVVPGAGSAQAQEASGEGLIIQMFIDGFRNRSGVALIALYDSDDAWLELDQAKRVMRKPIRGRRMEAYFRNVPPGTYAVSVIHDENRSDDLDMSYFPIPSPDEGAGVSNNAEASIGPPSWSDSRFRLRRNSRLDIDIRY